MTAAVRDVVAALEAAYPLALAESWDAVGLICCDPERSVRTVSVCGGARDSLLGAVNAADLDAYVTADLRDHLASEHLAAGGPALVDVAHWASEHPRCAQAAAVVSAAFGGTVDVRISYRRTDPWMIGSA
jgi:putative NIF3 family GTP cyclohydrolase 1 type 2